MGVGLALVGPGGCRAAKDAKLAEVPLEHGDLVAVFPPDGALQLIGDVPVEVVLGSAAEGTVPTVTLTRGTETTELPCVLGTGGNVVDCGAVAGMTAGEAVALSVTAGATTASASSAGRTPAPGIGWDLLDGVTFTALGGGGEAVNLANGELDSGHAFVALDGYDGTPGAWTLVGGESALTTDGTTFGIAAPGFAFVLPAEVDSDGQLTGSAPTAWLPSEVASGQVHLLLLDVSITGQLDGDVLTDLVLEAHLPALALEELAAPLGALGPELLDVVSLDVDRDGDGTNDAATVRLEGAPAPATLSTWATVP